MSETAAFFPPVRELAAQTIKGMADAPKIMIASVLFVPPEPHFPAFSPKPASYDNRSTESLRTLSSRNRDAFPIAENQ